MRILFAVSNNENNNNDDIVDVILNEYQRKYKRIISYKRAFYYNAILDEIKETRNTENAYDLIVISEDLEKNVSDSYETEDLNLYSHMDEITDEAYKPDGTGIPIILICGDRRSERDPIIKKLFVLGMYNILAGRDRTIQNVCSLIENPRNKKNAKIVYNIDPSIAKYENGNNIQKNISNKELLSITRFFVVNKDNIEKCVRGFRKLVREKNELQLQTIISNLPLEVKLLLEENSEEYVKIVKMSGREFHKNEKKIAYESKDLTSKNNLNTSGVIIPSQGAKKGIFRKLTDRKEK